MAAQDGEDVYATLLLTDTYLPGALVLAHSLRDAGTTKKLVVLVTLDTVSAEVVAQLQAVFDHVLSVPRIRNERPANLHLMDRPDLHSAFTKINLWKQTQFRKIVYIDADVVANRAPDELFDLPHAFSAAPDIGWPDLFNTGVMALTPNMGDYYALMAMAERGISFDGADQGLLNMYFKNGYNRLSFAYNVTPSAHYQYIPAYRHFQSTISMLHFIGTDKPWFQGRHATTGSSPYNEMIGRWWTVYDRHYRKETSGTDAPQGAELVQYLVKGEYQPKSTYVVPTGQPHHETETYGQHHHDAPPGIVVATQHHHEHHHDPHYLEQQPPEEHNHHAAQNAPPSDAFRSFEGSRTEAREEQVSGHQESASAPEPPPPQPQAVHKPSPPQAPLPAPSWDAQRQPPPTDSKPEAANFPHTRYEMSSDPAPFVPPPRYPSPPRGMWYEVPKPPPPQVARAPKPIFPWEGHQKRASRVFADEPPTLETDVSTTTASSGEQQGPAVGQGASAEKSYVEPTSASHRPGTETPTTPTVVVTPSDPWSSFTRTNAWDDNPQIERYVDNLQQKHRRTKSGGTAPVGRIQMPAAAFGTEDRATGSGEQEPWRRRGSKLTDFPSEVERPSLPVTPAPIRRPKFWGGGAPGILGSDDLGGDDSTSFGNISGGDVGGLAQTDRKGQQLPAAQGVPTQSDWDPVAQLQKLARQQSELLLQKLGHVGGGGSGDGGPAGTTGERAGKKGEIPSRSLPFGSEDIKSPTYVAQSAPVFSPRPVKPESGQGSVDKILGSQDATPRISVGVGQANEIEEPSYKGPGVMYEKGEEYPVEETPALPTEEEMDALEDEDSRLET